MTFKKFLTESAHFDAWADVYRNPRNSLSDNADFTAYLNDTSEEGFRRDLLSFLKTTLKQRVFLTDVAEFAHELDADFSRATHRDAEHMPTGITKFEGFIRNVARAIKDSERPELAYLVAAVVNSTLAELCGDDDYQKIGVVNHFLMVYMKQLGLKIIGRRPGDGVFNNLSHVKPGDKNAPPHQEWPKKHINWKPEDGPYPGARD